jgi:hypothetical protein
MNNYINFETYLYISPKKLVISVNQKIGFKKIYKQELIINKKLNQIDFDILNNFLNQNIFKIEKILKSFVKNIYLIIDFDVFFTFAISVKKKNYENSITSNDLIHLLNEAKDQCENTFEKKKIAHIIIDNYKIDKNDYSFLPKNVECSHFSLDIRFICINHNLIKNLEDILKTYQISLERVVSSNYIKSFFDKNEQDIFAMSKNIIEGCNKNEVFLINKTRKNKGFFEKFFEFFN